MLFRIIAFSLVICCALLHEAELAFSGFVSSILLLYKLNYVFCFMFCVCVYAFCSVLNAGIGRKRGEASRGGCLLRGVEQAGKLFCFLLFFYFLK